MENFNDNEDDDEVYEYSYDSKVIENIIVEKLMLDNKNDWKRIRGGKYVRFDVNYAFPKTNRHIMSLPSCNCGLPCDIKKNDNDELYFRCAKKNIWHDMQDSFNISPEPCLFFKKYDKDREYKIQYEKRKQIIKQLINKSYWLKNLAGGHYEFCVGGCGKEYDPNNTIRYAGKAINLCFECFISKNDELSKKYKQLQRLLPFTLDKS